MTCWPATQGSTRSRSRPGRFLPTCRWSRATSGPATSRATIGCVSPMPCGASCRSGCSRIESPAEAGHYVRRITINAETAEHAELSLSLSLRFLRALRCTSCGSLFLRVLCVLCVFCGDSFRLQLRRPLDDRRQHRAGFPALGRSVGAPDGWRPVAENVFEIAFAPDAQRREL